MADALADTAVEAISVLLVEDDDEDALLARELLADAADGAFDVQHVRLVSEMEDALTKARYDCALVDLSLPDARQLDAVEKLRSRAPEVAIVVLTGFNDEQLAVSALHKGAQDYLIKGRIEPEGLSRSIRYAIERRHAEARLSRPTATRHRTITLLFTNLVGAADLLERLGDEGAEQVSRTHFHMLRDAVVARGGQEVKNIGDGLMVAFPSALDAVGCAIEMQRAVARHNRERPDRPLQVRVGLNVGEPIQREDDYFGTSVVVAKRLCDAAVGGQILASDLVRSLIGSRGGHEFRRSETLELKGLADPISVHEVAWEPDEQEERFPIPPAIAAARRTAFVGRAFERERLQDHWTKSKEGHPQVVFVTGEPGIGKTRLAEEFAREVHAQGATVLYGRADRDAIASYQPFAEALSHYVAACPPAELRDRLNGKEHLQTLLPDLTERIPDLPEPPKKEHGTERYWLFGAVVSFLAAASEGAPLLLVLEDLHWADQPTLLLLKQLARQSTRSPLLVLATYRDTERTKGDLLSQTLLDLRREGVFERLEIGGLGEDAVTELARTWSGHEVGPQFTRSLHRQTGGNPFFIEEILRHIEGSDPDIAGGPWTTDLVIERVGIPDGVQDAIAGHLSNLSAPTNHVLRIASVIGPEFDFDVLAGVSDLPEDRLLDALEEGVVAGLLEEVPGTAARYVFAHALVRETLYAGVRRMERVRLHGAVGSVLERSYEDAPEHYQELARHFARGSRTDAQKAFRYASQAGRQAMEVFAYERAAELFELALEISESLGVDPERRAQLMLALGEARTCADDPRARETLIAAAEAARESDRFDWLAHSALGIHVMNDCPGVPDDRAIELLEEALELNRSGEPALRARLLSRLGAALYYRLGTAARRQALVEEAETTARRLDDRRTLAYVLRNCQVAMWGPDTTERHLDWVEEILELVEPVDAVALHARMRQVDYLLELDDLPRAELALQELERMSARSADPRAQAYLPLQLGRRAAMEGRYAEFEQHNDQAASATAHLHDPLLELLTVGQRAVVLWTQDRMSESEEEVRPYAARGLSIAAWPAGLVLIECELGRDDEARRQLAALAQSDFTHLPRYDSWLLVMALLADVCARLDDAERAAQIYRLLRPFDGRNVVVPYTIFAGPVSRYLGMLAATCKDWDAAVRHFASAREAVTRQRARPFEALLCLDEARMLTKRAGRGDRERTAELLSTAVRVATELGAERVAERAEALRQAS